jgi:hypothetical protein
MIWEIPPFLRLLQFGLTSDKLGEDANTVMLTRDFV